MKLSSYLEEYKEIIITKIIIFIYLLIVYFNSSSTYNIIKLFLGLLYISFLPGFFILYPLMKHTINIYGIIFLSYVFGIFLISLIAHYLNIFFNVSLKTSVYALPICLIVIGIVINHFIKENHEVEQK